MYHELNTESKTIMEAAESFSNNASINSLTFISSNQIHIELGFLNLIYVGAISVIEGLLADMFTVYLMSNEDNKLKLFNVEEYKKNKYFPDEIIKRILNLDWYIDDYVNNLVWHRFPKIKAIYMEVLGIDISEFVNTFAPYMESRHDIIHRGGRKKNGENVEITPGLIEKLQKDVTEQGLRLIDSVATKLEVESLV